VGFSFTYLTSAVLLILFLASADDDQACGTGKGSGKWSGPANGKPESEPC